MDENNKDYLSVLEALEFDQMDSDEQEEIIIELTDLIFKGTMIKVMEQMSDSDKEGLFKLEDNSAPEEEISEYIKLHLPNSDALVQETLEEIKNDILAVTAG